MLTRLIYPIISAGVFYAMLIFIALLVLRLIFNYSDPNPFGKIGRFSYQLKKRTDRFVYPAARLLASFGVDTRLAPLVTILISAMLAYFAVQIIGNTFFIIDGLTAGVAAGNIKWIIGFILYAVLSVYVLLIFIRFISSWFVFTRNTFFGFVKKATDPVLLPFQRLIPPIGMFDISAMVVLILIQLLQIAVLRVFGIT
ncbi:MAG: YggT family protein [Acidobacteriota bacterium]|nr:YggT family protein [Acidobacteriota bacterium]